MDITSKLPTLSNGVVINEKNELYYGEVQLRELDHDELLIQIHSAVINPADILFTQGLYPICRDRPTTVGFEGSGKVIATGTGERGALLLGKKVSFFSFSRKSLGSWGEHIITSLEHVVQLPEYMTYEEGATCLMNPLTVRCFIDICKKKGYNCIVNSAAAGSLGKLLVHACNKEKITLINIVRRTEQINILKEIGAQYIINIGDPVWPEKIILLFKTLSPKCFFDTFAGQAASKIIEVMPRGSTIYNYGALSLSDYVISPTSLIFEEKVVRGFWLTSYLEQAKNTGDIYSEVLESTRAGGNIIEVVGKFPHEEFKEAMNYYRSHCSLGKVLLQNPKFV